MAERMSCIFSTGRIWKLYKTRSFHFDIAEGLGGIGKEMSGDGAPPETVVSVDQSAHERRFERFLQAFLAAQEAQTVAHQQQTEDFAQFQAQVLDVIDRVAPPGFAAAPVREADPNLIFERFLKRGPPEFTSTDDPMVADDWIVRMEKIFRVFECTGHQRVQLAAYMFRGVAEDWWRIMQRPYEEIGDEVAWTAFKTDFLQRLGTSMAPKTYKGKRPPSESSSGFNRERFKKAEFAERFESLFSNRTVIFERIVVDSDLTGTRFLQWLHANGLSVLMHLEDECFEDWVREFYCNIFVATHNSFKTYVRGKTLTVDAARIASLLNLQRPSPRSYPFPDPNNIVIQGSEVATVLCGAPTLWDSLVLKIIGLTTDYRLLNTFVCHNIEPRSHSSDLQYDQAFLLYSLSASTSVDIPLTIFESMLRVYHEPRRLTLPYGAIICKLLIEAGCHAYSHEVPISARKKN